MPFSAAPHADVLALLIQLAALLLGARLLGAIAQRLGQPSVVGEIGAGVVLGPSILGRVWPEVGAWITPQNPTQGHLLEVVSLLGAMFLLLATGMEMDLRLIRQRARTAVGVSLGGVTVCLASGFALGWYMPEWAYGAMGSRLLFALVLAIALSISSIPVIAKVLMDLKVLRRDVGQTIIAAGMTDDTIGWILLSVVAALASGAEATLWSSGLVVLKVLGFIVVSLTLGRWLFTRGVDLVLAQSSGHGPLASLVVGGAFLFGAIAQALHFEAVLGAFVLGIIAGQVRKLPNPVVHDVQRVAIDLFAPIFFAAAGLKVDIGALAEPRLVLWGLAIIGVASVGKIAGTYAGARLIGRAPHWTALAFGAGLNARGAMGFMIAAIGLGLEILSAQAFSLIVVMAIATSMLAPPCLRFVLARVLPDAAERHRLEEEARLRIRRLPQIHRVLLPVRRRPVAETAATQSVEAWVVGRLEGAAVVLATVVSPGDRAESAAYLSALKEVFDTRDTTTRLLTGDTPAEAVVREAGRGYELVVIGVPERPAPGARLFSRAVDDIVRGAPCATAVVRGSGFDTHFPPRRILVPVNASPASQAAIEFAVQIAAEDIPVHVLNVVSMRGAETDPSGRLLDREVAAAQAFLRHTVAAAAGDRGHVSLDVRAAVDVEAEVIAAATALEVDLIILGTAVLPGTGQLYLGPRVERLLGEAPCPVIVLNS